MKRIRKLLCLFLSCSIVLSILVSSSFTAFASPAVSVVPSVAEYVMSVLFNACGVDVSLSSASSMLGSWSGYDDYQLQGKQGRLGSFSQHLYDIEHSAKTEELRNKAKENFRTLDDLMKMDWSSVGGKPISLSSKALNGLIGGVSDGASNISASLKGYFSTFPSYGTSSPDYIKPSKNSEIILGGIKRPGNLGKFVFSFSEPFGNGRFLHVYNFYNYANVDVSKLHLVYNEKLSSSNSSRFDFFYVDSSSTIRHTFTSTYWTYDYEPDTNSILQFSSPVRLTYSFIPLSVVKTFPFPVFYDTESANRYAHSGSLGNVLNPDYVGHVFDAVNKDAQTNDFTVAPSDIALPHTGEDASKLLQQLHSAMGDIAKLQAALKNAGLAVDYGDIVLPLPTEVPVESSGADTGNPDTSGKITLSDILAGIRSIPASVATAIHDKFKQDDSEQEPGDMKLPVDITKKFPFCIPFDIAYLVTSMNAKSEVPHFEFPFKIHYLGFNYEHTFIIDFSMWAPAVKILRAMLDLLFIAGLMSVTRDLIRG